PLEVFPPGFLAARCAPRPFWLPASRRGWCSSRVDFSHSRHRQKKLGWPQGGKRSVPFVPQRLRLLAVCRFFYILALIKPTTGETYDGKFERHITPGVCNPRRSRSRRGGKPAPACRQRRAFRSCFPAAARKRPQAFGSKRGRGGRTLPSHPCAIRRSFFLRPAIRPAAAVRRS